MGYLPKLFREINAGKVHLTPGIIRINVFHSKHCPMIRGRGECNCNADVQEAKPHGFLHGRS
jgi:hypothetical protein